MTLMKTYCSMPFRKNAWVVNEVSTQRFDSSLWLVKVFVDYYNLHRTRFNLFWGRKKLTFFPQDIKKNWLPCVMNSTAAWTVPAPTTRSIKLNSKHRDCQLRPLTCDKSLQEKWSPSWGLLKETERTLTHSTLPQLTLPHLMCPSLRPYQGLQV